jgi:hypothetical protein
MQRDAAMHSIYILFFTANLLYMFRVPLTPIIRSTGTCSRRPLVQVIYRGRLDCVASSPLGSIRSKVTVWYTCYEQLRQSEG